MRTRLTKAERRADILAKAKHLIVSRGLDDIGMEDIRVACDISRGGLYHHFSSLNAVLNAIVEVEVAELEQLMQQTDAFPIVVLLQAGSNHLGGDLGVLSGLHTQDEKLAYVSALDHAFSDILAAPLSQRLGSHVKAGIDPDHVAELFLTVNSRINRHEILGHWSSRDAARFSATALKALATLFRSPSVLDQAIADLTTMATGS